MQVTETELKPCPFCGNRAEMALRGVREFQINAIITMLKNINDVHFLNQIRTILKLHIERKDGAA